MNFIYSIHCMHSSSHNTLCPFCPRIIPIKLCINLLCCIHISICIRMSTRMKFYFLCFILAQSIDLSDITLMQASSKGIFSWFFIPDILGFVVFFISALAMMNRIPFDFPEADSYEGLGVFYIASDALYMYALRLEYLYQCFAARRARGDISCFFQKFFRNTFRKLGTYQNDGQGCIPVFETASRVAESITDYFRIIDSNSYFIYAPLRAVPFAEKKNNSHKSIRHCSKSKKCHCVKTEIHSAVIEYHSRRCGKEP